MSPVNLVRKSLTALERILGALCVTAFVVMVVLAAASVFFRFVINSSLAFPDEIVRYLFVWLVFLGAAIAYRRNMHASVEVVVNWMPQRLRRTVLTVANLLCIAFFLALVIYGVRIVKLVYPQESPALEISMSYVYAAVPVGAALMLLYALEALVYGAWSEGAETPGQADG